MPTRGMCHEYRSYDRTLLRGQVCAARAWNFKLDLARLASRAGTSFSPREEFIFSPPRDPESIYSWLFAAAVPREIFFFQFMDLEFTSKSRTSLTSSSFCWLYFWKHSRSCNRDPLLRDDHGVIWRFHESFARSFQLCAHRETWRSGWKVELAPWGMTLFAKIKLATRSLCDICLLFIEIKRNDIWDTRANGHTDVAARVSAEIKHRVYRDCVWLRNHVAESSSLLTFHAPRWPSCLSETCLLALCYFPSVYRLGYVCFCNEKLQIETSQWRNTPPLVAQIVNTVGGRGSTVERI